MVANQSYKIIIFTSLLSGTIIWLCYRACLTGELSIVNQIFPFHDLESLSTTDWKLMANKPDTATAGVFINSLSSSAEYKVYSNNMDNESFIGHPDYLDYVLKNSKSGFFALDSQVDDADIC